MANDQTEQEFQVATSRLLRREALRRAAADLSTATPAGLESALARISEESTSDAAERVPAPAITSPAAA